MENVKNNEAAIRINSATEERPKTRMLAIGNMWDNRDTKRNEKAPDFRIRYDQNMADMILTGGGEMHLYINKNKREGRQDPEARVFVSLPEEVTNREIERQRSLSSQKTPVTA